MIIIANIVLYQKIFKFKSSTCRYYPSCSEYSLQAFKKYNFIKAFGLSIIRILKCNPIFIGGFDPLVKEIENE